MAKLPGGEMTGNYSEGYKITELKFVKENRKRLSAEEASDG